MENGTPAPTGRLTVVLGYAAGVGKTYRMLEEGQKLALEGHDVVIGYFEPHGRADTMERTRGLDTVPRRLVAYRGKQFEEMDLDAILRRHPEICLVDEFPHTNVPGLAQAKRWEDVLVLLAEGIHVITTMNIQHLESLNDQILEITGVRVRETVPDWVIKRADELVLVDLTPRALLNRLDRGVVYSREKAQRAKENFFKEPTLAALREMALRQAAHEVEVRQLPPLASGPDAPDAAGGLLPAEEKERILIHVTDSPAAVALIRRGRRVADYLRAECFAVAIDPGPGKQREVMEQHLEFARKLRVETRVLPGGENEDEARTLVDFAHRNGVTQIFLPKPPPPAFPFLLPHRQFAMRVIRLAKDMQVTVVAERRVG